MERGNEKYSIGEYICASWRVPYHFLGAFTWYWPALGTLRFDEIVDPNAEKYDSKLTHHMNNFREYKNVLMSRPRDFGPYLKNNLESKIS